jgi:hypothetical protein
MVAEFVSVYHESSIKEKVPNEVNLNVQGQLHSLLVELADMPFVGNNKNSNLKPMLQGSAAPSVWTAVVFIILWKLVGANAPCLSKLEIQISNFFLIFLKVDRFGAP